MRSDDTIKFIRSHLEQLKDNSNAAADIATLESLLKKLKNNNFTEEEEDDDDEDPLELTLQINDQEHQWEVEEWRSSVEASQSVIKACLVITGGSAAALLAFAGSAWSSLKPEGIESLGITLKILGFAIFLTALAGCSKYLAQHHYLEREPNHKTIGNRFQNLFLTLIISSYGLILAAYFEAGNMLSMFNVVRPILIN
ncbi:hypothetical protein [Pseudomonas sp. GL-B-26]|uniref:hypothetical protein n=1 Tax=Pseudomonas sp. GL-B-26 TaxID=2832394 RepID=UPI001CBC5BA8|nr:hypothetical protein [Pseudomonas sp. GL-B-26]